MRNLKELEKEVREILKEELENIKDNLIRNSKNNIIKSDEIDHQTEQILIKLDLTEEEDEDLQETLEICDLFNYIYDIIVNIILEAGYEDVGADKHNSIITLYKLKTDIEEEAIEILQELLSMQIRNNIELQAKCDSLVLNRYSKYVTELQNDIIDLAIEYYNEED